MNPTLRLHDRDPDRTQGPVYELQRRLVAARQKPGTIDGWFGPKTYAALTSYQLAHGLGVDGVCGPETWGKLLAPPSSPPSTLPTGAPPPPSSRPGLDPAKRVERVHTPAPYALLVPALARAYALELGKPIEEIPLSMAVAHLRFEHGVDIAADGTKTLKSTYCNNLGNLMTGKRWSGPWFQMDAAEREDGKNVVRHSTWQAFADLDAGARGYWRSLRTSFPKMLFAMHQADPRKVAEAGKSEGYFTDELDDYAKKLAGSLRWIKPPAL